MELFSDNSAEFCANGFWSSSVLVLGGRTLCNGSELLFLAGLPLAVDRLEFAELLLTSPAEIEVEVSLPPVASSSTVTVVVLIFGLYGNFLARDEFS